MRWNSLTGEKVTYQVSSVRVELSSVVIGLEVDLGLVNEADDLDIVRGPHVLDTLQSTRGNDASAAAWLGAPRYLFTFSVRDNRVWLGWGPETEVWCQ